MHDLEKLSHWFSPDDYRLVLSLLGHRKMSCVIPCIVHTFYFKTSWSLAATRGTGPPRGGISSFLETVDHWLQASTFQTQTPPQSPGTQAPPLRGSDTPAEPGSRPPGPVPAPQSGCCYSDQSLLSLLPSLMPSFLGKLPQRLSPILSLPHLTEPGASWRGLCGLACPSPPGTCEYDSLFSGDDVLVRWPHHT